jgi:hypothetical protein
MEVEVFTLLSGIWELEKLEMISQCQDLTLSFGLLGSSSLTVLFKILSCLASYVMS